MFQLQDIMRPIDEKREYARYWERMKLETRAQEKKDKDAESRMTKK